MALDARPTQRPDALPPIASAVFRGLLPRAERDEVLDDLAAEYGALMRTEGRLRARLWFWRQVLGSVPALLRRSWWRGWTGFEPRASRMEPGGPMFESWIIDLRYSARRLASRPGYATAAVLTLALGAGGTAAIFSVVRALLLEPLPVRQEEQVGVLWFSGSWTEQEFVELRPDFPGFQRVTAYRPGDATLEIPGQPLRLIPGITASAELFDVLGADPLIGRAFLPGDDLPGAVPVAVLSHRLWQELGADPSIVGRQLQLGGLARMVVGVMPPGFWFPDPTIGVWTSVSLDPRRRSGQYTLVGRIAEGRSMTAMQGPLDGLARTLGERYRYPAQWDKTRAPAIESLREALIGDVRPSLLATFAAIALILGIACVNVAALLLGQVGGRSTELSVRAALGADRGRLIQQLTIESLLVGTLAAGAGALVAAAGFRVLVRSLPLGALAETVALSWSLFWSACLVALLASMAIAIVAAAALSRFSLQAGVAGSRTSGISARGGRLESALIVAQIALAVLLAGGAGLLLRSVANLRAIDPGLDTRRVAVVDATMPTELSHDGRRRAILDVLPALQALPGVRAAAATQKLPLRGSGDNWSIAVEGKPDLPRTTTAFRMVTHDYFRALGVEIVRGRGFLLSDRATTERVVVINEALAAKYFPGEDPLGRVLRSGFGDRGERIVGVVADVAEADLTDPPVPARYMLYDQVPVVSYEAVFVVAASSNRAVPALLQAARATLQRESTKLAIQRTTTMAWVFDEAVGAAGRIATLLMLLAGLALVLAAVGVYGVISHFVNRRTREYGIRIALGLRPARVVSQVVGRGVRLAVFGSALGATAIVALGGTLSSLLYQVDGADPVAVAGAALALVAVGAVAAFVPARRASRTDPALVLRQQ
jgi:predicted permease